MLVVSDTSPINILVLIEQIEILPVLFGHVIVPSSVTEELRHPSAPPAVQAWMNRPPVWLSVAAPSGAAGGTHIRHQGERDAIALALEKHADALLVDEIKPRREAMALGLPVIGTIGLLQRAADEGHIDDLGAVFDVLRKTNFRVSDRILQEALARHQARKA